MSDGKKSPYNLFTMEEIMAIESGKYVIQVGSDLLTSESGKMAFGKDRAEELFSQALSSLNEMKKSTDPEEQEDALKCLSYLRIIPFRIH